MGLKPAQRELSAALQSLFARIPNVHIIHDDLIIATETQQEHENVVEQVMEVMSVHGLTMAHNMCVFRQNDGVQPDPSKVETLDYISFPRSKDELISFLCMMQSNSDFIPSQNMQPSSGS